MGYGRGHHVGRTGDGGIDCIIDQDALGLDRLYVQAKRRTYPVGGSEIRNFSGSLGPHGATMGILISTSNFTDTARRTADTISIGNKHIRLVNGQELTQLMLHHGNVVTTDMATEPSSYTRTTSLDTPVNLPNPHIRVLCLSVDHQRPQHVIYYSDRQYIYCRSEITMMCNSTH